MGKVREMRFRVHANATKKSPSSSNVNLVVEKAPEPAIRSTSALGENIFAGISIDVNQLAQNLPDNTDTCSTSGRSRKGVKKEEQHLPKKEKMRLRHERFMQKLDSFYSKRKINKKKSKKAKSMETEEDDADAPLLVPLGSDDDEDESDDMAVKTKNKKKKDIPRASMKLKKRMKEDLKDARQFRKILNDSVFRRNPGEAIKQLLKQRVAEKRPDLDLD